MSAWHFAVPDMARRIVWDWIPVEDGVLTSVGVLADADSTLMLILVAADPKHLGAEIGFFAVLHSWGQNLLLNPH